MAFAQAAQMGGVEDIRLDKDRKLSEQIGTSNDPIIQKLGPADSHGHNTIYLDSSIPFEGYHWWAARSRAIEKYIPANGGYKQMLNIMMGKKPKEIDPAEGVPPSVQPTASEKQHGGAIGKLHGDLNAYTGKLDRWGIEESEWETAQRAGRTATWGAVFYLITTDILGPYSVPWAFAQMGYGPGMILYSVFGIMAWYSGMQLWKCFQGLDSTRYPMRNYGDLAFRIFGNWARQGVNILQSFQFFLNVTLLIVSNGQGLVQMAAGKSGNGTLCFVVAEVIFMLAGFLLGQIRTLQRLGFLANLAVWLNIIAIFMTIGVTSNNPPNYQAVQASYNIAPGPVKHWAWWPPSDNSLTSGINGLMNGVYSYGGATLFNELMSEMRRPWDFWKSLLIADVFIYSMYITMGLTVYTFQGQYAYNPAYQGIPNSQYSLQTLGNAINFISGLIAALLYGNIGIKVMYAAVLRDVFKMPPLDTKKGKWLWVALVPVYWGCAFILAAGVPQVANLSAFVGAAAILQFTYTFPPLLMVGFNVQKDAILPEEEYNPETGEVRRQDYGVKRWIRGYKRKMFLNTFDIIYFLGALSTAGLGIYTSVTAMNETFKTTSISAFSCGSPTG